jgi:hypothetical protein
MTGNCKPRPVHVDYCTCLMGRRVESLAAHPQKQCVCELDRAAASSQSFCISRWCSVASRCSSTVSRCRSAVSRCRSAVSRCRSAVAPASAQSAASASRTRFLTPAPRLTMPFHQRSPSNAVHQRSPPVVAPPRSYQSPTTPLGYDFASTSLNVRCTPSGSSFLPPPTVSG